MIAMTVVQRPMAGGTILAPRQVRPGAIKALQRRKVSTPSIASSNRASISETALESA